MIQPHGRDGGPLVAESVAHGRTAVGLSIEARGRMSETRQQMIDRLIGERERRIADEAERYKDKQLDEPAPVVGFKYMIKDLVRLRFGGSAYGVVTNIHLNPHNVTYDVRWSDTRSSAEHYEFELEGVEDDDSCENAID